MATLSQQSWDAFFEPYNQAVDLLHANRVDDCADRCEALIADRKTPIYIKIKSTILLANCLEDSNDAFDCHDQAQRLIRQMRAMYSGASEGAQSVQPFVREVEAELQELELALIRQAHAAADFIMDLEEDESEAPEAASLAGGQPDSDEDLLPPPSNMPKSPRKTTTIGGAVVVGQHKVFPNIGEPAQQVGTPVDQTQGNSITATTESAKDAIAMSGIEETGVVAPTQPDPEHIPSASSAETMRDVSMEQPAQQIALPQRQPPTNSSTSDIQDTKDAAAMSGASGTIPRINEPEQETAISYDGQDNTATPTPAGGIGEGASASGAPSDGGFQGSSNGSALDVPETSTDAETDSTTSTTPSSPRKKKSGTLRRAEFYHGRTEKKSKAELRAEKEAKLDKHDAEHHASELLSFRGPRSSIQKKPSRPHLLTVFGEGSIGSPKSPRSPRSPHSSRSPHSPHSPKSPGGSPRPRFPGKDMWTPGKKEQHTIDCGDEVHGPSPPGRRVRSAGQLRGSGGEVGLGLLEGDGRTDGEQVEGIKRQRSQDGSRDASG